MSERISVDEAQYWDGYLTYFHRYQTNPNLWTEQFKRGYEQSIRDAIALAAAKAAVFGM